MDDMGFILWAILFGAVGTGYIVYGKKQQHAVALLSGVMLCVFPYLVTNPVGFFLLGILFIMLPFFLKL
jgi:hypothetical protein